jgi:hypothetical protein
MITALTLDFSLRFNCNLGSMAGVDVFIDIFWKAIEERTRESRGRNHLRLIELFRVSHSATADYSSSYGYRRVERLQTAWAVAHSNRGRRCPIKQCQVRHRRCDGIPSAPRTAVIYIARLHDEERHKNPEQHDC